MAWLSSWAKRIKLTIDSINIESDLVNFPILAHLEYVNANDVFEELYTVSGTNKIAVTSDNGTTQCYVEIERWDWDNKEAELWVKAPTVSSGTATILYLYYDATVSGNTTYVGNTGDASSQNVWDSNFVAVYHMGQDPTSNDNLLRAAEVSHTGNPATAQTGFGPIDCTGLTKANGALIVELKCDNSANIAAAPATTFEITSGGAADHEEWWRSLSVGDLSKLNTNYKTFVWPLSDFTDQAGGVDVTQIDYAKWYAFAIAGNVTLYWKNARVVWPINTILDSTSNTNDGTVIGAMTSAYHVDGKIGKTIYFDSADAISIPADPSLKFGTGDFTVESIFETFSSDSQALLGYGDRADNPGWTAYIGANGVAKFIIDDGTTQVVMQDVVNHADAVAHTYSATLDRDANGVVYIDGAPTATENISGANLTLDTTDQDDIEISRAWYNTGYTVYYTGKQDEIRISNIVRSAAWVKATYYSNWNHLITYGTEELIPTHYYNGYVTEKSVPVNREVRLYYRDTGELIDSTTSSGVNGYYYMTTAISGEHFIVAFDDAAGDTYNALVNDRLLPVGVI